MIEHRRDPPGRLHAEKGERRADRVRQHQADPLAGRGAAGEPPAEHEARGDRAVVGERRRRRVFEDAVAAAMRGPRFEQRREQARRVGPPRHHLGHDVVERRAGMLAPRPPAQLGRDRRAGAAAGW